MIQSKQDITIKSINVKNFKSFKNLNLTLDKFNVIAGANATGKSNFIQIFSFLKDIVSGGLNDAIALQGGHEHILNFVGTDKSISFEITFESTGMGFTLLPPLPSEYVHDYINWTRAVYQFEIRFTEETKFEIVRDVWNVDLDAYDSNSKTAESSGKAIIQNNGEATDITLKLSEDGESNTTQMIHGNQESLSIEDNFVTRYVLGGIRDFLTGIGIYDFDPKSVKNASVHKGRSSLENNGSNLAIVLKSITTKDQQKRQFYNQLTNLLPFISSVDTQYLNKSVHFIIKENYFQDRDLASDFISDGTANIIAMIVALYFQSNRIVIIEEPERNIHPALISRVVEMLKEASDFKQVIVTTHSPEIMRYAEINSILITRRDDDGCSEMVKIKDEKDVQKFLADGMNVGELHVHKLLGD